MPSLTDRVDGPLPPLSVSGKSCHQDCHREVRLRPVRSNSPASRNNLWNLNGQRFRPRRADFTRQLAYGAFFCCCTRAAPVTLVPFLKTMTPFQICTRVFTHGRTNCYYTLAYVLAKQQNVDRYRNLSCLYYNRLQKWIVSDLQKLVASDWPCQFMAWVYLCTSVTYIA